MSKSKSPVEKDVAAVLPGSPHNKAIGRFTDRSVRLGAVDPLIALLEQTATEAREAGLTEAEIEAELAAYNAERRNLPSR